MQNNVTELTDKLLRALDTNYNVTDMQTVIDIIVLLDKVAITKEVLEATRLGKYVNELRRNTSNDWLAKRAKELVKKWRNLVLPPLQHQQQQASDHSATTNNGQVKQQTIAHAPAPVVRDKPLPQQQDSGGGGGAQAQNQLQEDGATAAAGVSRKRSAKEKIDTNSGTPSKRLRINGGSELDLSDTSNSSFHDAVLARNELRLAKASTPAPAPSVILVNSDSNSSLPEVRTSQLISQDLATALPPRQPTPPLPTTTLTPPLTSPSSTSSLHPQTTSPSLTTTLPTTPSSTTNQSQQQRRRGRRKGSSAHRNLLDEADASFTSKMARGANARVKTTQELVASLQGARGVGGVGVSSSVGGAVGAGKLLGVGGKEDLVQKAAKLTERVVEIDQKLNTNANRYKNNGGSTTPSSNKHHHHRHNNNNNNNLSNNFGTSEGDDEDVIVVDEDEFTVRQHQASSQRSGRHRKRRDSAGNRLPLPDDDNVTIKHEEERATVKEEGAASDSQSSEQPVPPARSLETALALSLLPPIERSPSHSPSSPPPCSCRLIDNTDANLITTTILNSTKKRSDFSIGGTDDEDDDPEPPQEMLAPYEWEQHDDCSAEAHLRKKYRLCCDNSDIGVVKLMHERYIPGVNCNTQQLVIQQQQQSDPLRDNSVVPDVYRDLQRKLEAYKPYSISEGGECSVVKVEVDDKDRTTEEASDLFEYREYHETLDVPSYNGETLRILPYVIID